MKDDYGSLSSASSDHSHWKVRFQFQKALKQNKKHKWSTWRPCFTWKCLNFNKDAVYPSGTQPVTAGLQNMYTWLHLNDSQVVTNNEAVQCLSISVPKSLRGPPSQHTCWPKLLIAFRPCIVRSLGRIISPDRVRPLAQCNRWLFAVGWCFPVSAVVQRGKKNPKPIRSINTLPKSNNAKCLKHFSLGRLDFTRYKSVNLFLAQKVILVASCCVNESKFIVSLPVFRFSRLIGQSP